jgi:energy-coupling factor transport system ATP-binding protein
MPTLPSSELLRVDRLAYRYSPAAAAVWSNLSFEIRRGERIALFGPNGAGKSTLLAALSGVFNPTEGRVVWQGESDRFPATLVPQRADLTLFNRTVADELAYGPRQLGLSADVTAARVKTTAERLGLAKLLDEQPQALSQGQRVRTAVAAALTMSSRLLLLDEPTTGQDSAAMRAMLEALSSTVGTSDGPEAVVFSTHDHEIATRYADRVFRLADGVLTVESPRSDEVGGDR